MTDITRARPSDLSDIQSMIRALSAFHGEEAAVTLSGLQDIFFGAAPMGIAFIARMKGRAVGYAGLTPTMVLHDGKIRLDIHHLYVTERARSKGVGKALIAAARVYALDTGATRLTIGTDASNAIAIAAYRAMPLLEEMTHGGPRFRVTL